jgi:hypothetical protein
MAKARQRKDIIGGGHAVLFMVLTMQTRKWAAAFIVLFKEACTSREVVRDGAVVLPTGRPGI